MRVFHLENVAAADVGQLEKTGVTTWRGGGKSEEREAVGAALAYERGFLAVLEVGACEIGKGIVD